VPATVERVVRNRNVGEAEVDYWINTETLPLLRQMRQALNQTYSAYFTKSTAHTGTFTAIWTSPDMASGKQWLVDATIEARSTTAARSAWTIRGLFYSNGTVTQSGATTAVYTNTVAVFAVRFAVVGNHVEAQVQDDGALDVDWGCWIELREFPA
jgi:hypothetical protein